MHVLLGRALAAGNTAISRVGLLSVFAVLLGMTTGVEADAFDIVRAAPTSDRTVTGESTKVLLSQDEKRIRAIMEGADRVRADRSWIPQYVRATYGPVIDGLPIEASLKDRLIELLAQRKLAVTDANQLFSKNLDIARRRHLATAPNPNALNTVLQEAASQTEREIKGILDPQTYAKVMEMIAAESELSTILNNYAKEFKEEGFPLSPEQWLHLASTLHNTFGSPNNPKARRRETLPLNASGLTELDEDALKMMEGILPLACTCCFGSMPS